MAIDFFKEKSIKYLNKDFKGFKRDLINFSQAHHSGVFQDFNETSPGMALLELCAYVGDVLSFYQDMQFEELKHESARQIENVVSFAKSLGYKPAGKRAAHAEQTFFIEVPATTLNGAIVPDDLFAPNIKKGASVLGPNGTTFETLDDVNFSLDSFNNSRIVTGSRFDDSTGLPTHFAIQKSVEIVAGETKEEQVTISDFQQFRSIELSNQDVLEVISIFDSDGNEWVEVDYLAQDSVFDSFTNVGSDSSIVPYVLKFVSAPRRFITDRDPTTNKTSLIFGSGEGVDFDDELIPNIADLALPLAGRRTFTTFALDPQNFLKTRSLGLSPFNTTLTIRYRVGGGSQTNVPVGTIRSVNFADIEFSTTGLDPSKKGAVESSLETINLVKSDGGGAEETITEIKANSAAFFAAQARTVTREDFITRILTLPAKYGKPEKVFVKRNNTNQLALNVHILSRDVNGYLAQASQTLVDNIKTYLSPYRMLTDGVNLLQTNIINLKLNFGIVISAKMNKTEVLTKCLNVARDYFDIAKTQVAQPIVLSDLSAELQSVFGVISVYKLEFRSIVGAQADGTQYSGYNFNISSATANGIIYCPDDSIFEIKFPARDIVGESK